MAERGIMRKLVYRNFWAERPKNGIKMAYFKTYSLMMAFGLVALCQAASAAQSRQTYRYCADDSYRTVKVEFTDTSYDTFGEYLTSYWNPMIKISNSALSSMIQGTTSAVKIENGKFSRSVDITDLYSAAEPAQANDYCVLQNVSTGFNDGIFVYSKGSLKEDDRTLTASFNESGFGGYQLTCIKNKSAGKPLSFDATNEILGSTGRVYKMTDDYINTTLKSCPAEKKN